MVTSGIGDIYMKDDDSCYVNMVIVYCFMLYIIYVTFITMVLTTDHTGYLGA